ncbi:MAG: hypothetical protein PVJ57_12725 [Phycisphaerae bacterium]|jgi:flavin-dependent dehydrogenase
MTAAQTADGQDVYDLLIAGATAAGAAAAIHGQQLGLRTLLIDTGPDGRPPDALDWLGPKGTALCAQAGVDLKTLPASEFSGVELRSWDLQRQRKVDEAELCGWIVSRAAFVQGLCGVAQQAGAELAGPSRPVDVALGEEHVTLTAEGGGEFRGRLLLVADGPAAPTAGLARLPAAHRSENVAYGADLVLAATTDEVGLDVIIGARRTPQVTTIMRDGRHVHVSLMTRDTEPPIAAQFEEFLGRAREENLLLADAAQPVYGLTPAGVALDLETLVGKRCVLVGEAGGFAAAFSRESLYPEMTSGWIAAEACQRALAAKVPQDELLSFSSGWRTELAEYLRLPHTDLALLMPLVFENPQMSARVARAFLLGQGL